MQYTHINTPIVPLPVSIFSSGLLTLSGLVCTKPCIFRGFSLRSATQTAVLVVYNSPIATTDPKLVVGKEVITTNNTTVRWLSDLVGIRCDTGLYYMLSGVGVEGLLYYSYL